MSEEIGRDDIDSRLADVGWDGAPKDLAQLFLLFLHCLDDLHKFEKNRSSRLKKPMWCIFLEAAALIHEQIDRRDEMNEKLLAVSDLLLPRLRNGETSV
jgi:hypothetical protein